MDPILAVDQLTKCFFVKGTGLFQKHTVYAVNGVSLSIGEGETLGLVGESGCGKTTTGRCILRLVEPTSGSVVFRGQDVSGLSQTAMSQMRREMQIIFQDPYGSLTPRKRVYSLLREPLDVHRIGTLGERRDRVASVMQQVGLRPEHMDRYPHEFSGGQRQRICIARAIVAIPKLVIADEPVSALDVSIRAQVLNLMAELQDQLGLSYLLISHDLSVVKYMCDRIAVMYLGKIVEVAESSALGSGNPHPYTEALLSAIPVPVVGKSRERIVLEGDAANPMDAIAGCVFHPRCRHKTDECEHVVPDLADKGNGRLIACHLR